MEALTVILNKHNAQAPHDERKRRQSQKLWLYLGSVAGLLSLGWLIVAFKSGAFIGDDSRYAVSPGDFNT